MSQFLQRNKRKGALAALLLLFRRGKGLAALMMMILMLSSVFIVPSGFFMGIPWVSKTVNMLGLAALFGDAQKGGFEEFAEALRSARSNRNLMPSGAYRSRGGGMTLGQSGMDLVKGGSEARGGGEAKTYDGVAKDAGASVGGVLRPEDSKKMNEGVALSEDELSDGLLKSALGGSLAQGGGPGGGGVFSDRMGLRSDSSGSSGSMALADSAKGVGKFGGAKGGLGASRAVTRDTKLASAVFRAGARGQSYLSGASRGQLGKMNPGGASYSRAYGGGGAAAADDCFQGAPGVGPGQQKAYVTGGHRAQGTPTSADASGESFGSLAAGCVLGEVATPASTAGMPAEFSSGVSGAIYDGNKVDAGMIATPDTPTPVTPDMTEVGDLLDQANQMEEDAKKCEEAEATYGPQERQHMSNIQDLSAQASSTCGGGGCEDNEDECRRLCNEMTSECNQYNTVASQKAAACPLSNGQFEAMDCTIGGGC